MAKFHFRLQKLLEIRIDNEEESKRKFKNAMMEKNIAEERLNDLKSDLERFRLPKQDESIIEQKIRLNYSIAMGNAITQAEYALLEKENIVEVKRNELKKKQIERKTVEILKDKNKAAFLREQELAEQKTIDELALYGYIRKEKEVR